MVRTLRKGAHILDSDLLGILLAYWVSFLLETQQCSKQQKKVSETETNLN